MWEVSGYFKKCIDVFGLCTFSNLLIVSYCIIEVSITIPSATAEEEDHSFSKTFGLESEFSDSLIVTPPRRVVIQKIRNIAVNGNSRVSTETILSYFKLQPGEEYDSDVIDKGVKEAYESGMFSDLRVHYIENPAAAEILITLDVERIQYSTPENRPTMELIKMPIDLVISVSENPVIGRVGFDGNKEVLDEDLEKICRLRSRSIFSESAVKRDTVNILTIYKKKGYFTTQVKPKLVKLQDGRVNVVYEIKEGPKAKIGKVKFVGNSTVSEENLTSLLLSKEAAWFRFLSSASTYDQDKLEVDKDLLKRFYNNLGYADFQVIDVFSELSSSKTSFLLTYSIYEGPRYTINKLEVENNLSKIHDSDLRRLLAIKKGQFLNQSLVSLTEEKMKHFLGEQGYAFAKVDHEFKKNEATNTVTVVFKVDQGFKIHINKINIVDNVRTLDKVIRREMAIDEGDSYSLTKINQSERRIGNLGYFSNVKIIPRETNIPDKVDLDVKIQEASTGSLNFNVGYNTVEGMVGTISASEQNLLGMGNVLSFDLQKANRRSDINLGLSNPYFMDRNLLAGVNVFKIKKDFSKNLKNDAIPGKRANSASPNYTIGSFGVSTHVGYFLGDDLQHILRYTFKKEEVDTISPLLSSFLKAQPKSISVSAIGHTLSYDKRNSVMWPTHGYLLTLKQDLAGLGGNAGYIRNEMKATYHHSLYKNEVIMNLIGRYGIITGVGKPVYLVENFFIGSDYIRGFSAQGIGPRDKATLDSLGGKRYYAVTTEVIFPFYGTPADVGLKLAVFHDATTLYDFDVPPGHPELNKNMIFDSNYLRSSYGAGIIWQSPLGLLRLDYAIPYRKTSYDLKDSIKFSFGKGF